MKTIQTENGPDLAVVIGGSDAETLAMPGLSILLCPVEEASWNKDLSPWPAEPVFRGAPPFAGGADAYFESLLPVIRPALETHSGAHYLCGYSLAGLFALYTCTNYDLFDGCVSASGSLWYPGWTEWLSDHPVQCSRVYLSLGEQEKHTKHALMKTVEERTRQSEAMIGKYAETVFELNEGGHFADEDARLAKGLAWLCRSRGFTEITAQNQEG